MPPSGHLEGFVHVVLFLVYLFSASFRKNKGYFLTQTDFFMDLSYKNILATTFPVLMSVLMEHCISMTDTAFLGRVGEVELGASALSGVYYLAIFVLGLGFSVGVQIIIGRRNGEKDYARIGPVFMQGLLFLLGLATILFFLSRWLSPWALSMWVESKPVCTAVVDYLNWRVYGFFFAFMAVMFRAFFVGTTKTRILTINSLVMVLANVVLNYLLIFGKFGFPRMGIAGAAIASSLAELISVIFFLIYTWKYVDLKKYGFFRFREMHFGVLSQVLKISIWTMIQYFVAVSIWFIFFLSVAKLGERPLAVTNIVRSVSSLAFIVTTAFSTTGSSLISNLIGEGKADLVLPLCRRLMKLTYLFVLPVLVVIFVFPTAVLRIYTDNMDLVHGSVPAMLVMAVSQIIFVPMSIYFSAVSGTGNTRGALYIEFAALAVYLAGVYFIVIHLRADIAICWINDSIYAMAALIFSYLYMTRVNWSRKKI